MFIALFVVAGRSATLPHTPTNWHRSPGPAVCVRPCPTPTSPASLRPRRFWVPMQSWLLEGAIPQFWARLSEGAQDEEQGGGADGSGGDGSDGDGEGDGGGAAPAAVEATLLGALNVRGWAGRDGRGWGWCRSGRVGLRCTRVLPWQAGPGPRPRSCERQGRGPGGDVPSVQRVLIRNEVRGGVLFIAPLLQ